MQRAWDVGRAAVRDEVVGDRPQLRAALIDAGAEAPDWIVPQRDLDQLDLAALRGPQVWARRMAAVESDPGDASALYLLGRLEGEEGTARMEAALRHDRAQAWAYHALSVNHELRNRSQAALESERRALELARDPFSAGVFANRVSLLALRAGDRDEAREVLEEHLLDAEGAAAHAASLRLARLELQADDNYVVERGYQRGLALLRERPLTNSEAGDLLSALQSGKQGRSNQAYEYEVVRALLDGERPPALALGRAAMAGRDLFMVQFELSREAAPAVPRSTLRAAFRRGDYAEGARAWLAVQPSVVLDESGQPRDERLRRLFATALVTDAGVPQSQLELCRRLIEAGWADLAEVLLDGLGSAAREGRVDAAEVERLDLASRAIQAISGEIDEVVGALFRGRSVWSLDPYDPDDPMGVERSPNPDDIAGVLDALTRLLREFGPDAGLDDELIEGLSDSPRVRYGPIAAVVAPGPFHGVRDQQLGLGDVGDAVPGLAAVALELGRFALFGDAIGRAPDGTLLLRLWSEERSGEHLGAPWSGVITWCGGAEADGARSRGAGEVSGAALHEGYWIDVEAERARLERWRSLEQRFIDGSEDAALVLGLETAEVPSRFEGERRRVERRRLVPPMLQSDRVALAILQERHLSASPDGNRELLSLDDLLEVVQVHEEGHLCDRSRFLPLGRNFARLLGLLLRESVGELGIERRVEYRAQAVALACVSEPRLALIDLLDAAEVDTRNHTVHAFAYRRLLEDFLVELDRELAADPAAFPALDGERYLVHQLHRLTADQVRAVAIEVARNEGLVEAD
ncbi:hypothetical protein [Engelhardtia mirabilis]|uniref:Tetratricopeptide repeat protein n=1 Tax=Engelhardtia mirabilis TaxID=2528011 RepID=A0A518BLW8_9BACT|nr:hypothetical protein Pla133_30620 [Planctomycetes bacterium Pla133]QDV02297.1 hypothetical protein Pla86_30610 [Planctomycetes bacterium Pla86]